MPTDTPPDWLTQADWRIIELLARSREVRPAGLWLTPANIATNLHLSRTHVSQRLAELRDAGYVETDGEGYYRITDAGATLPRL